MTSATPLVTRPPLQARGQRTLDRIVKATEHLLRTIAWEEITVADIVREAETSTGSFYQRFNSKEALLPYIYDLYNVEIDAEWRQIESDGGFAADDLEGAVRIFVRRCFDRFMRVRWLLRAMAIYARQHPGRLPKSAYERNERVYRAAAASFVPHMRCAPAEAKRRARVMTYALITLSREYELFGDAPLASALSLSRKQYEEQLVAMATAYLGSA